jgi:alpha-beta hydrolase superfamily lysophospholipase
MLALDLPHPKRARRLPMLVLGAGGDWIFPEPDVRATATAYGVEPVLIDDLAHDVMLDPHWERAAEAVVDWLGSLAADAGR